MAAIFKYNGKYIAAQNLQKKLKKMHLTDVEIIWEGEATMQELDLKIRDLTSVKEDKVKSTSYIYRVYSNTIPPEFLFETDKKPEKNDKVKVLTLNGDVYISYE